MLARGAAAAAVELLAAIPEVKPAGAVRGQYGAGTVLGKKTKAYRQEPNVAPNSNVETYAQIEWHASASLGPASEITAEHLTGRERARVMTIYRHRHRRPATSGHLSPTALRATAVIGPRRVLIKSRMVPAQQFTSYDERDRAGALLFSAATKLGRTIRGVEASEATTSAPTPLLQ